MHHLFKDFTIHCGSTNYLNDVPTCDSKAKLLKNIQVFQEGMSTRIMKRLLTWPGIQYTKVMQKCVYEALAFIIPNLSPTMAVKCTEKKKRSMLYCIWKQRANLQV